MMDIEERKKRLAELSIEELEAQLKKVKEECSQPIIFDFKVTEPFLNDNANKITIPKKFYPSLECRGIKANQEAQIIFPNGSIVSAYIYFYAETLTKPEYYQIHIRNYNSGMGLADLKPGDTVKVKLFKSGDKTHIELSSL